MAKRLDDVEIETALSREEFPELLAADFPVAAFVILLHCTAEAATQNRLSGDGGFARGNAFFGSEKILELFFLLAGVAPIRPGLNGHQIVHIVPLEFQINALGR